MTVSALLGGMWCAPSFVNLKRGEQSLGQFTYGEILGRLRGELDKLIEERQAVGAGR